MSAPLDLDRDLAYEIVILSTMQMFTVPPFNQTTLAAQEGKVLEEALEFHADPTLEEAADVLITIIGWARLAGYGADHLITALHNKNEINRARKWRKTDAGNWQHV